MRNKIVKVIFDDGEELKYDEKPLEHFLKKNENESWGKHFHRKQHESFEKEILYSLHLDLEDWVKDEYGLVDEDEVEEKNLNCFADYEIYSEAESRGLFEEDGVQNKNILNESFIDRFINIINKGDNLEIEKVLEQLENKYKIG